MQVSTLQGATNNNNNNNNNNNDNNNNNNNNNNDNNNKKFDLIRFNLIQKQKRSNANGKVG